jgi:hypothetical protein
VITQNDQDVLGKKISALLDRSASELRQGTAYRLQLARQAALEKMAGRRDDPIAAHSGVLAGAGGTGTFGTDAPKRRLLTDLRVWIAILVLAGGAYVYDYWKVMERASEIAELDAQLLGSDLPFDAFLDSGFENWLKRSAP